MRPIRRANPFLRQVCNCVLIANVLLGVEFALADDDPIFRFRGRDYTETGSHVAHHVTWSSKLPFDKAYADLTPKEQAFIRDQYTGLSPDEEPPFPTDGLRAIFRAVDESADQLVGRPETGPVVVVAKVDE